MSMNHEICQMDAVTLATQIRAKQVSAVEVIDTVLHRMEVLNPQLNAFCTPTPDLARQQAQQVDAAIARGDEVGLLAGVPVAIKDLVCTQGIRTVSGSKAYEHFIPEEDDVVVERLKAAGAIMIGKTNVPEFGYVAVTDNPVFGPTRNPWNPDLTPGGSSGGSTVAVATGMCPFAIASDGGGSIRIPASFCGVYGIKASMGRVPAYPGCRDERYPGISSWESIEHIGPVSRTVADSALMLSVIAGPDDRDRHSLPPANFDWQEALKGDLKGLRVAYSPDWGYAAVDPQVRQVIERAVHVFEQDLGCTVDVANPGWEDPADAFAAIIALESDLVGMRQMAAQIGGQMTPYLREFISRPWTAEDFTTANRIRKALCNKMWRFMRQYDLLLTPTLSAVPFPIGIPVGPEVIDGRRVRPTDWLCFTFPMNLTGQPAASIPAGWTKDGLPVGLQIIGRHLDDPLVLRASAAFEAAQPWRDRQPPVLKQAFAHSDSDRVMNNLRSQDCPPNSF